MRIKEDKADTKTESIASNKGIDCSSKAQPLPPEPSAPSIAAESNESEDSLARKTTLPSIEVLAPAFTQFDNAGEWMAFVMPELPLYPWQREELMRMSGYLDPRNATRGNKFTYTDHNPNRSIYCCANGSGKDQVLIAGFSTFFAVTGQRSKVVITSSSDNQLKTQTEPHINRICESANKRFGQRVFHSINHYKAVPSLGSQIKLFATDEAGKAEGEHPDFGGRMAILVNEAKSIKAEIWDALSRCSGFSHWIEVSSPGDDSGQFFDEYQEALMIKNVYPYALRPGLPYARKITCDDCPHITQAQKDAIHKRGDLVAASSLYAQFMSVLADTAIPRHLLNYTDDTTLEYTGSLYRTSTPCRTGLDIGAGVDATCLSGWAGTELVFEEQLVEKNLLLQLPWIKERLAHHGFNRHSILGDDNGVGQAVLDGLSIAGYSVTRLRNQGAAFDKQTYLNQGAEMYANVRDLLQAKVIGKLPPHIIRQLSIRRWVRHNGKLKLEDKEKAKVLLKNKSPNESDAMVLAWYNLHPTDFKVPALTKPAPTTPQLKIATAADLQRIELEMFLGQIKHLQGGKTTPPQYITDIQRLL